MSGCFDNSRALVKEQTGVTDTGTIYFCRFGYFFRAVIVERFYDFVKFFDLFASNDVQDKMLTE